MGVISSLQILLPPKCRTNPFPFPVFLFCFLKPYHTFPMSPNPHLLKFVSALVKCTLILTVLNGLLSHTIGYWHPATHFPPSASSVTAHFQSTMTQTPFSWIICRDVAFVAPCRNRQRGVTHSLSGHESLKHKPRRIAPGPVDKLGVTSCCQRRRWCNFTLWRNQDNRPGVRKLWCEYRW